MPRLRLPQFDWSSRLWWTVPATTVLLMLLISLVVDLQPDRPDAGTTYDASQGGLRLAYLLMEDLGYPVSRSKRPVGEKIRFVFFPTKVDDEARVVGEWVRGGGVLVLADDKPDFARHLGINLDIKQDREAAVATVTGVPDVERLAIGKTRVSTSGSPGEPWGRSGSEPIVTRRAHGQGQVWLLHRPDVVTNQYLRENDNALFLCRLADELLSTRSGPIAFDEFFHGLRSRPGVTELLLRPPALAITLQSLVLVVVLLWARSPRFGALRQPKAQSRRSKEEFLDALAALLERKGDAADALQGVRAELRRDLEQALGLPQGLSDQEFATEVARRRGLDSVRLLRSLRQEPGRGRAGAASLVTTMTELENLRDEFFQRRHHPSSPRRGRH